MTPELEAKAKEWLLNNETDNHWLLRLGSNPNLDPARTSEVMAEFAVSQLSAERKWWIERIEQERDRCYDKAIEATKPKEVQIWRAKAATCTDLIASARSRVAEGRDPLQASTESQTQM